MPEYSTFYPQATEYPVGHDQPTTVDRKERAQSAAPEWFTLMRDAAPELSQAPASHVVEPARASARSASAVRQFLTKLAESRGAVWR